MKSVRLLSIRGISVVEVLFGISLFAVISIFVTNALTQYFITTGVLQEKTKALYLATEGQEIMRYVRDDSWVNVTDMTVDTVYYFDVSTTTLATTTSPEVIDGTYTRSVILHNAYRNSDDDLVASTTGGASIDAGSRLVVTKVNWGIDDEIVQESLLTNLFDI